VNRRSLAGLSAAISVALLLTVAAAPGASALPSPLTAEPTLTQAVLSGQVPAPPSAVPLMVGAGTATALSGASGNEAMLQLTDYPDFEQLVANPSPSLLAAVQTFYFRGGSTLYLQLTPDESAASLERALTATTPGIGQFELVSVPSLGELSGPDYQLVALAADRRAAGAFAMALLDPPNEVVAQVVANGDITPLTNVATQLRSAVANPSDAVLLSSGLLDSQNNPVSASATVAGLITANDNQNGFWTSPGGPAHAFNDLHPVWSPPNAALADLEVAGANSFRSLPGYGTVLWGDFTLQGSYGAGATRYINLQRVLNQVTVVMRQVNAESIFALNNANTWAQVTSTLSSYLDQLWLERGLMGEFPSQAYQVVVGPGLTSGEMAVVVQIALERPDLFTTIREYQQLQPS
jgi:hypothetical protein